MKKALLLFAVAALGTLATKAQVRYGVRGGVNFSNVRGSDLEGNKGQTGFHIGALAEIGLPASGLSIQPEIQFSGEGAKSDNGEGIEARLNLSYINVPVLVKYTFQPGIFVTSGPQLGFLASAKAKIEGESSSIKDQFKSTNLSWAFGAGYLSPLNIGIDLRYNLGLSKLAKEEGKVYSNVFQVGLFYVFGDAKK